MQKKPIFYRNQHQESRQISAGIHNLSRISPMHWHNFLELEIVVEGSGEQILNGKRKPLYRGIVSLLRLTDYHQIEPEENLKILNISFDEKLISKDILVKICNTKSMHFDKLGDSGFNVLEKLGDLVVLECKSDKVNLNYVRSLLDSIFIKLLDFNVTENESVDINSMQFVLQYLRSHFRDNPSLTEIAEVSGYNPEYLSVLFHKEIGIKFSNYLLNLKLNYAKSLLLNTDSNIEYISYQCGFGSYAAFRRAFLREYGLTPSNFRKFKEAENKGQNK